MNIGGKESPPPPPNRPRIRALRGEMQKPRSLGSLASCCILYPLMSFVTLTLTAIKPPRPQQPYPRK